MGFYLIGRDNNGCGIMRTNQKFAHGKNMREVN